MQEITDTDHIQNSVPNLSDVMENKIRQITADATAAMCHFASCQRNVL